MLDASWQVSRTEPKLQPDTTMTQKDKIMLIQSRDRDQRGERKSARDYRDYKNIRHIGKHAAKAGKATCRYNSGEKFKSGNREFIEVGTAVGREISGHVYGIHSIQISMRGWVLKKPSPMNKPLEAKPDYAPIPDSVALMNKRDRQLRRRAIKSADRERIIKDASMAYIGRPILDLHPVSQAFTIWN